MDLEIILASYSLGDASERIFGYSNKTSQGKILEFLQEKGYNKNYFDGKNKNRKYHLIIKTCPSCGSNFETESGSKKEKETCSIKCSNSFKPKRIKKISDKKRKRTNNFKSLKIFECIVCKSSFQRRTYKGVKTCSPECLSKHLSNQAIQRVENGTHSGWQSRPILSYPEKFFMMVLDNNKIKYSGPNYKISKKDLGLNEASCFFLDFYIEKNGKKIDLEIDGKQHEYPDRKESDSKRDKILESAGFIIYRIKWKALNSDTNKDYIKEQILLFLEFLKKI